MNIKSFKDYIKEKIEEKEKPYRPVKPVSENRDKKTTEKTQS